MERTMGYRLLDAGGGRRLDAFVELVVDRPAPGAEDFSRDPAAWSGAIAWDAGPGWHAPGGRAVEAEPVAVPIAGVVMEARLAASGQVGIFPEHAEHAEWLTAAVRGHLAGGDSADPPEPQGSHLEVLNLFAYTGLATLVAAQAGASVVHVDASRPAVQWARHNAELSSLADRPIRWIVDDALDFVRRESRRGRRYGGLILDPPTYGHGAGGRGAWRFDERIQELLDACAGIADPDAFWLLTTHSPGWSAARLADVLASALDALPAEVEAREVTLIAESGARLPLGVAARLDPLAGERR